MKSFVIRKLDTLDQSFLLALILSFFIRIYLVNFTELVRYPYLMPDSWSWLSDGLHWAGYNTQISFRPPIFPLLISILYRMGLENFIILYGQLFSIIAAIGVYILGSKLYNKEIGLYSGILFLANGSILGWSSYVLADIIAVAFMVFAFCFFFIAINTENNLSKYFFLFGLFCGFSFLAQYTGILIFIIVFIFLIFERQTILIKRGGLFFSFLVFMLIVTPWFIYRWVEFGNPFYSTVEHIQLLRLRMDCIWSFMFYTINTFFFASASFIILTISIIYLLINKNFKLQMFHSNKNMSISTKFNLIWITLVFSFFVFVYYWNDNRFVIYYIVPIIILSSTSIYYLRRELKAKNLNKYFIFIFIIVLLSTNIIFLPPLNKEYMVPPVFSPVSGTTGIISLSTPDIELAYPLIYHNYLKFSNETYEFGLFANVDPFVLPNVGQYISANSNLNDVVAIKPIRSDPGYWYIIWNQLAVETKRQTTDTNSINNFSVKFIITQGVANDCIKPEFDNFTKINYEWNNYILYKRLNS